MLTLPYPKRKAEIMTFVRKHHYSRRCPGVWSVAYGLENNCGKLQAVVVFGPPPYPSIARAFVREPDHTCKVAWQARMVGAGISAAQLDTLIGYANRDLSRRGFWWVLTLTDPTAHIIERGLLRLISPGYSGEVYHRNGFLYLGTAGKPQRQGWLIDGKMVHCRQGATTLSQQNVHSIYPNARSIREIHGTTKHRWAYVLGTASERAQRILLMRYHPQPWEAVLQPRLFTQDLFFWLNLGEKFEAT